MIKQVWKNVVGDRLNWLDCGEGFVVKFPLGSRYTFTDFTWLMNKVAEATDTRCKIFDGNTFEDGTIELYVRFADKAKNCVHIKQPIIVDGELFVHAPAGVKVIEFDIPEQGEVVEEVNTEEVVTVDALSTEVVNEEEPITAEDDIFVPVSTGEVPIATSSEVVEEEVQEVGKPKRGRKKKEVVEE